MFPISVAESIPYAPHLKPTINTILSNTVTNAVIKLPIAYFLLSPNPLDNCNIILEKIHAITLVAKKYLYSLCINGDIAINIIKYNID